MNNATKRTVLRWIHLIFTIPVLGYIYGPQPDVQQYADAVKFIFIPILVLSGFWMWNGYLFAILGAALWVGVFMLFGFGPGLLGQIALFICAKVLKAVKAKRGAQPGAA